MIMVREKENVRKIINPILVVDFSLEKTILIEKKKKSALKVIYLRILIYCVDRNIFLWLLRV